MRNAIESGVFLAWFTARAALVGVAYLMARGKGRNLFGWTLAAAFGGLVAVVVLAFAEPVAPPAAQEKGIHLLKPAPARSRALRL